MDTAGHEQFAQALSIAGQQSIPVNGGSIDRILRAVREHLGAEIAFVSRYVESGQKELTHVDSDLDLPMGPGFRDPRENSYCWHILEGRLPELIQDVADHPFTGTMGITDFLPVGAHINTPLRLSDGTVYGSFCCLSRKPDRSLTERDLGVLRAFATLAVEQIENSLEDDQHRSKIEASIDALLRSDELSIAHQPIVELASGLPVGVECLARFPDALSRGPDRWFADASTVGRGVELELLAIERALATRHLAPADGYISVNASPETIVSGKVERLVAGIERRRLVVEVTEHQEVEDFAGLKRALASLSKHARIAIDDVGAGYAGLRHLVDLAPDILKLDMRLTRDIHRDPAAARSCRRDGAFAAEIGCRLVAEGIETPDERDTLVALGVDYGQGYLFGRPQLVG